MLKRLNEFKVGLLIVMAFLIILLFFWLIGERNPFRPKVRLFITYHFAGGIEKGSPVRLSGIKVGKVESLQFVSGDDASTMQVEQGGEQTSRLVTPLKIEISLDEDISPFIKKDSQFYINLAGLIGERYIEVTPGTSASDSIKNGDVLRGIDPPRIDQLISQSFNLAGKIQQVVENHEGDITKTLELISTLSANLNKTLGHMERSKLLKADIKTLVENLIEISKDVKVVTKKAQQVDLQKDLELIRRLLKRAEEIDKQAVEKFFQKDGVRVRLF
jgi:phospholipid/cholesterol/gamma-HCH transport system substrate-binding protein